MTDLRRAGRIRSILLLLLVSAALAGCAAQRTARRQNPRPTEMPRPADTAPFDTAPSDTAHLAAANTPPADDFGTMPQLLKQMHGQLNPRAFAGLNVERVAMLRRVLAGPNAPAQPAERIQMENMLASELLKAGDTEQSLQEYHLLEQQVPKDADPEMRRQAKSFFLMQAAICYLRLGEQQNCCASNNAYSCLLPISGAGIHTKQYGARNAVRCLTELLQINPADLKARWLLNIAYMTLGGYPKAVPARWLIPLKDYGAYPMHQFYNAAPDMGLNLLGWAGSVIMEDFEGNGRLDLMVSSQRPDGQLRYLRNNGDGTFSERTKESGLLGETDGLNIITTDYNNDGRPDIIILRGAWYAKNGHFPLSLLRNDGHGHFTDVTRSAGLMTFGPTQTAVAFDYNGDGLLDLFIGYESTEGDPVPCKLFRNNGDGTFTDVTQQCGLNVTGYVKAVVSADYTHSGRPGLYLACWDGPNILLRNDGPAGPDRSPKAPWRFTDVSHQAGVDKQRGSFSAFFFDADNDGWPDLYVGGAWTFGDVDGMAADYLGRPTTGEKARLYHNNRDGTFTDISRQAHLDKAIPGMGINYGDLDNDGWLDFYVGTGDPDIGSLVPNRMFRNHDGRYFDEVTTTGGFGDLQKGHGIAFGDLSNNGQQDVFEVMGGAYSGDTAHDVLFVNPGSRNHWVTLELEGVRSNRIALGAEICVSVATPHGDRKIYRTVSTGGSFGNNPLRQEIGLGDATGIKSVGVRWPASGITQEITGLGMDRFYKVREGDLKARAWPVSKFPLPRVPGAVLAKV